MKRQGFGGQAEVSHSVRLVLVVIGTGTFSLELEMVLKSCP